MEKYIKSEAARLAVFNTNWRNNRDVDIAYDMIDNIPPAADVVEVRHGRWVWNENAMDWGIGGWVCSECRAKNDNIPAKPDIHPSAWVGSQYCPHCGCKMDKGG